MESAQCELLALRGIALPCSEFTVLMTRIAVVICREDVTGLSYLHRRHSKQAIQNPDPYLQAWRLPDRALLCMCSGVSMTRGSSKTQQPTRKFGAQSSDLQDGGVSLDAI